MTRTLPLILIALLFIYNPENSHAADRKKSSIKAAEVADRVSFSYRPNLNLAHRAGNNSFIEKHIQRDGASFIKVQFKNFNLRNGDRVLVLNSDGREIESLTGFGPKNAGQFWSLSVPGDSAVLRFEFSKPYSNNPPFQVTGLLVGNSNFLEQLKKSNKDPLPHNRSVCGSPNFEDAVCFQFDTGRQRNIRASAGVLTLFGNPQTGIFCSGSNVSPDNYVLTNEHCISNQIECDGSEFLFGYQEQTCGGNDPSFFWTSYRCNQIVASEPLVACDAAPGERDFTLASVFGNPSFDFGFVEIDPTPITSGEDVYMVSHPNGRPQEVAEGGGADFVVDGDVLRYYSTLDTQTGSDGAPIFRSSDHKMVGIHHCSGCTSPGGNTGVPMGGSIYPIIQSYTCSSSTLVNARPAVELVEVTGNGDATIDQGETWEYRPSVTNSSCSASVTGVSGDIALNAASSDQIVLNENLALFDDFSTQTSQLAQMPLTFTVNDEAVCGDRVVIDLSTINTDQGAFAGAEILSTFIGEEPITEIWSEDFIDFADWQIVDGGTATGLGTQWTELNPGGRTIAMDPPFMIIDAGFSGLNGGSFMFDEELISPAQDVSSYSSLKLRFVHEFDWLSSGANEQADVDVKSATTTNGEWVTVKNYSGADAAGTVILDLTPYIASDLQIRFHYYQADQEGYWAIDDVALLGSNGYECDPYDDSEPIGNGKLCGPQWGAYACLALPIFDLGAVRPIIPLPPTIPPAGP